MMFMAATSSTSGPDDARSKYSMEYSAGPDGVIELV